MVEVSRFNCKEEELCELGLAQKKRKRKRKKQKKKQHFLTAQPKGASCWAWQESKRGNTV